MWIERGVNLELDAGVPGMHPTFAELGFEDPARRVTDVDGVRSFVRLDLWQDLEEQRCVRSCIRFPDPDQPCGFTSRCVRC
ncbi:MAG: hypothetical protein CMD83_19610, partial [Gammaproteobacteria bacterium]|nr:hypothetical protein [Gammaproteobacteria bacterium]